MTKEQFLPLLNQKVEIQFMPEVNLDFEVVDIRVSPKIESIEVEPFSLMFRGEPSFPIYQQGNYTLRSKDINEFSIFLVPRLPDKEGIYYEAIFS